MKTFLKVFLFIVVVLVINAVQQQNHPKSKTPLDKEADIRLERATAMRLANKRNLRDPDSVIWESVLTNQNGTTGCFIYRARNGFGGMNREQIAIHMNAVVDWNKHCKNETLYNIDLLAY